MARTSRLARREALSGWLFVLPLLVGISVFTYGALVYSLKISLTRWDLLTPAEFVGLKNFLNIFKDQEFKNCFLNTLFFVVTLVPSGIVCSMALAIILNRKLKGLSFFRSSFYLPSITSTIAVGMVWLWIFNPDQGVINSLLRAIGVAHPPRWLESTTWAKPALTILRLWQVSGYYMLMYLASLQSIPEELYEAAELDGATTWGKIRYITVPLLSNTTFFVSTLLTIEAFNIFEAIYVMTEGGPGGSTNTLLYYIYTRAFQSSPPRMGYAAAMAWVLFLILFVITLVQFVIRRKKEGVGL
ncbi:MAG: sugar ABC transporter permease [Chloroflexota bacterium]